MQTSINISQAEFQARADRLCEHVHAQDLSGVVLFDAHYVLYHSGFAFIPTERPIAFAMNAQGDKALFVPRLEVEHAQANSLIDHVAHYLEYPTETHPMTVLQQLLDEMGIGANGKTIGVDTDGYPWMLGYRGPALSELMGAPGKSVIAFVEDCMAVKSEAELALIRESVKWGNLAHTLLQRYTKVGATETEVSMRATNEATLAMLDAIGPIYRAQSGFSNGAHAGYRGQIGRNAAIPHAMANNITFEPGDVLVTGAGVPMWGYHSELERTMLIAPVTDDKKRMFDHMVALQDTAMGAMKPGIPCSEVDNAVRAYYDEHDLWSYWKHHSGHTIGLRYHEGPYLDLGDHTIMQPGMVFTVEPGLYVPELGGFRHSDTVAITEDGTEQMTYYPRDMESLTIR